MLTIYQLKSRFQNLLRPLCDRLASAGVTANQVTIAAVLLSVVTGACMALWPKASWPFLLLPLVLLVRMGLNALDGMLAREHGQQSKLGAILNEMGDVVSDACLYLPFAMVSFVSPMIVVLFILLAIIGEMMGIVSIQIGASRRYDGPMGKSDRAALFGLAGILIVIGVTSPLVYMILFGAGAALAALTIINRARAALNEVADT